MGTRLPSQYSNKYVLMRVVNERIGEYENKMVRVETVIGWINKDYRIFQRLAGRNDRLMIATRILEHVSVLVDQHCLPIELKEMVVYTHKRINGGYNYETDIDDIMERVPLPRKEVVSITKT